VTGKRVLDAGCGPGAYAQWLAEHGAIVEAFDANEKMVNLAQARLGDRVQVNLANLEQPLDFLLDNSFDLVVAPLVMDYVKDWASTFGEFHRVLKPGGVLVFSMEHPFAKFDDHRATSNYFQVERVEYTWRGFGKPVSVPSYRRPLSAVINPLLGAGFILDQVLEPLPTAEFKQQDPGDYEKLSSSPGFICVRAHRG
jgi:2-polyprenyl-3-methyl-5-hydroxy-6-metoxy-1,4-benzoquinol methylase